MRDESAATRYGCSVVPHRRNSSCNLHELSGTWRPMPSSWGTYTLAGDEHEVVRQRSCVVGDPGDSFWDLLLERQVFCATNPLPRANVHYAAVDVEQLATTVIHRGLQPLYRCRQRLRVHTRKDVTVYS